MFGWWVGSRFLGLSPRLAGVNASSRLHQRALRQLPLLTARTRRPAFAGVAFDALFVTSVTGFGSPAPGGGGRGGAGAGGRTRVRMCVSLRVRLRGQWTMSHGLGCRRKDVDIDIKQMVDMRSGVACRTSALEVFMPIAALAG
jgi:hypothetical protein